MLKFQFGDNNKEQLSLIEEYLKSDEITDDELLYLFQDMLEFENREKKFELKKAVIDGKIDFHCTLYFNTFDRIWSELKRNGNESELISLLIHNTENFNAKKPYTLLLSNALRKIYDNGMYLASFSLGEMLDFYIAYIGYKDLALNIIKHFNTFNYYYNFDSRLSDYCNTKKTMKKFNVEIIEVCKMTRLIEAKNIDEAEEEARRQYENAEIVLNYDDFESVSFNTTEIK